MNCPSCGVQARTDDHQCRACGSALEAQTDARAEAATGFEAAREEAPTGFGADPAEAGTSFGSDPDEAPADPETDPAEAGTSFGGGGEGDAPTSLGGSPVDDPGESPTGFDASFAVATGWSDPLQSGASLAALPARGAAEGTAREGVVLAERYRILDLLGEGGMGAVYKAEDLELDRLIALKVIRPELARHPEVLQRFKQEIILARDVTHPNVVRIFDLGTANGLKFITMEFVEGRDLKSFLNEGRTFDADETIEIMLQVCRALEAAHKAGVVHRDLKPQNIMLDAEGKVLVMDFGVARSMESTGMTRTGDMIGTPSYMSPEQGQGIPIDARSDIYTLGIIFYELLLGLIPHESETPLATLLKRTKEPVEPPIRLDPEIPKYLNDLIVRCLEIEPELRYQSVTEIIADLEAQQAPTSHSTIARLPLALRRSSPAARWAMGLAGLLLVTVVGLTTLAASGRLSSSPGGAEPAVAEIDPISLAILPFRNTSANEDLDWLGASLAEMVRSDVGQSGSLVTVPTDRVHQIMSDLKLRPDEAFDDATMHRVGGFSNADTVLSGEFVKLGDQIRIDATLHDLEGEQNVSLSVTAASENDLLAAISELADGVRENMELSSEAVAELEATSFAPSSDSLAALRRYNEGLLLVRQGNYMAALESFQAAVEEDEEFALAYSRLAQTYSELRYAAEAEEASRTAVQLSEDLDLPPYERYLISAQHARIINDYDQAIEAYETLIESVPDDLEINFSLAGLYEDTGNYDEARDHLERVLRYDPNYVDALYALGRVEIRRGNPEDAIEHLNQARTITDLAENEDGTGRIVQALGIAYKRMNRPDDALRYYRESLEIRRRLDQKSGIAASLSEIAQVQQSLGNRDEALASVEEALALRREIGDPRGIGGNLIDLGNLYFDGGDSERALDLYKESLQIQRDTGNEIDEALCLNNIGAVYLERGEFSDALTNLEQALRLRESIGTPYELGETLHNLAQTTTALGQFDQALDYYLQALQQWRDGGDSIGVAASADGIGVVLGQQGRFRAALESHQEAMTAVEESEETGYWLAAVSSQFGGALSRIGRFEEAQPVLDEALSMAREMDNGTLAAQTLNLLAENAVYQGRHGEAHSLFVEALDEARDDDDRTGMTQAQIGLAMLDLREGRPRAAAGELETLSTAAERAGLRYLEAKARILHSAALLQLEDVEEARRSLQTALRTSERLEARPLIALAHYQLALVDIAESDGQGAARHYSQAARVLEEIRTEAGDEDNPLSRDDLRQVYDAVTGKAGLE
jgi:tetratricopeptide (TPR) repeat protein/predicted Ser/Thr protein kinase